MDLMNYIVPKGEISPLRAAVFIAMTDTMEEEKELILSFRRYHCLCTATMVNGNDSEALRRITGNAIGASLNAGLIERKKTHIHPLAHAIQEAVLGTRLDSSIGQNCRLKMGIVRQGCEIAVAIYGDLGFHECSSHKTIGGGYQILGE
ncbi:MAG: hypothetical protein HFF16_00635 [Angelakisella sp.]|jgi:hut operon positive regulator|nr:hypothetical protein [Angelakisella sp.]MCI9528182.1 hypothetical protein [Angelakisella sp.]